ncbi:hypothetical protein F5Y03DRAFT_375417, partial [Xylaria venustula]
QYIRCAQLGTSSSSSESLPASPSPSAQVINQASIRIIEQAASSYPFTIIAFPSRDYSNLVRGPRRRPYRATYFAACSVTRHVFNACLQREGGSWKRNSDNTWAFMRRLSYHCTLKGCASYLEDCSAGVLAICILLHSRPLPLLIENSAKNLIRYGTPRFSLWHPDPPQL